MNNVFFTSDLHFDHQNIMRFCPETRRFDSVEAMNEGIVENWNKTVRPNDTIYILGDIAFNPQRGIQWVKRLHGKKHLLRGNHDRKFLKQPDAFCLFESISDYSNINVGDRQIVLFHYPIWEWDGAFRGAWHFHGHVHGKQIGVPGKIFDVGLDTTLVKGNELRPFSLDELKPYMDSIASRRNF